MKSRVNPTRNVSRTLLTGLCPSSHLRTNRVAAMVSTSLSPRHYLDGTVETADPQAGPAAKRPVWSVARTLPRSGGTVDCCLSHKAHRFKNFICVEIGCVGPAAR